jgi:hypothetical protein
MRLQWVKKRVAKPEVRWKMGGPRLRWLEDPGDDLPELKEERRRQGTNVRKECISLLKKEIL